MEEEEQGGQSVVKGFQKFKLSGAPDQLVAGEDVSETLVLASKEESGDTDAHGHVEEVELEDERAKEVVAAAPVNSPFREPTRADVYALKKVSECEERKAGVGAKSEATNLCTSPHLRLVSLVANTVLTSQTPPPSLLALLVAVAQLEASRKASQSRSSVHGAVRFGGIQEWNSPSKDRRRPRAGKKQ